MILIGSLREGPYNSYELSLCLSGGGDIPLPEHPKHILAVGSIALHLHLEQRPDNIISKSGLHFRCISLQVVVFEKFQDKRGNFLEMNDFSTHSPMLSCKLQFLPHISSPSSQISNTKGSHFFMMNVLRTHSPMLSSKMHLLSGIFQIQLFEEKIWGKNSISEDNIGLWELKTFLSKHKPAFVQNFSNLTT